MQFDFCSNTINKHFHCVRAGCGFSFTRYSQMAQHLLQHQATVGMQISDKLGEPAATIVTIKRVVMR